MQSLNIYINYCKAPWSWHILGYCPVCLFLNLAPEILRRRFMGPQHNPWWPQKLRKSKQKVHGVCEFIVNAEYRKSVFLTAILPAEPGLTGFIVARIMEVVVTTGAIRREKCQSNHRHQLTNQHPAFRPDVLPGVQPTVSQHEGKRTPKMTLVKTNKVSRWQNVHAGAEGCAPSVCRFITSSRSESKLYCSCSSSDIDNSTSISMSSSNDTPQTKKHTTKWWHTTACLSANSYSSPWGFQPTNLLQWHLNCSLKCRRGEYQTTTHKAE